LRRPALIFERRFAMISVLFAMLLAAAPPLDGRGHPVQDDLLDQLAGSWKLTGMAAGRPEVLRRP